MTSALNWGAGFGGDWVVANAPMTTLPVALGGLRLVHIPLALCLVIGLVACGEQNAVPEHREVVAVTPFPEAPQDFERGKAGIQDEEPSSILKDEETV